MKKRDARRLSSYLVLKRFITDDFYKFVDERFDIQFSQSTRKYYVRSFKYGLNIVRNHTCCFRLCEVIFDLFRSSFTHFQGQQVIMADVKNKDLLSEINKKLAVGFVIQGCRNYGTISKLMPVKRDKYLEQLVETAAQEHQPDIFNSAKNDYVHSSRVMDNELVSPAFCKLASKPARPLNRRVCRDIIALSIAKRVMDGTLLKTEVSFTAAKMSACEISDSSSSGIIPVRPVQGVATLCAGKKKDLKSSAIAVNIYDRISGNKPGAIPVRVFLKSEVLKVGKPVRGILNESLANYIILKLADPDQCNDIKSGNAIGIGSQKDGFIQIFFRWYIQWEKFTGGRWAEFLDYLEQCGAHESDKVGWEAATNATDGIPWLVERLWSTKCSGGDRALYIRAISDYINPFVYLDRCGFYAPFRVPSGTYYTSSGNTDRHQKMIHWMCFFIKKHGFMIGSADCDCFVCVSVEGVGIKVSPLQVALRKIAFLLGDDYIAISMGLEADMLFDRILDYVFGTETKTCKKEWFSQPHCEFLRRSFRREGDRIHVWRQSERVLAKLYHGQFMCDPSQALAAMISFKFEIGHNRGFHDLLEDLMDDIREKVDQIDYNNSLKKFARRNPIISDLPFWTRIYFEDVINLQGEYVNQLIRMVNALD